MRPRHFMILLIIALFVWSTAHGQANTGVVNSNANLRAGPGTTYAIAGSPRAGQRIAIISINNDGTWYQIDNSVWIAAFLVDVSASPSATDVPADRGLGADTSSTVTTGATANRNANLREGPGTNYPVAGSTAAGAGLKPIGRNAAGDWLKLDTGEWIAAFLINNAPAGLPIVDGATLQPATPTPDALPPPLPTTVPTPPSNDGCHSSYDPCVPIASDVDCAGGSGNGPAYVRGPVRVVGSDVYGLDRDSDGIGCE